MFEDGVEQTDAKIVKNARRASILLMIDVSKSMKPESGRLLAAARKLIASTLPADEFEIVSFSWPTYVEQAFTTDRLKLDRALTNLKFDGGSTALFDAIDASIKETNHAHGPTTRVIVLFSDGVDTSSNSTTERALTRALKNLEAPSVYIVCTAPQLKQGLEISTKLATASGGMVFAADQPESFEPEVEEIARTIDDLSEIEYSSTHTKRDGKLHKLQVRYEQAPGASKTNTVLRQEYYAPSQ